MLILINTALNKTAWQKQKEEFLRQSKMYKNGVEV